MEWLHVCGLIVKARPNQKTASIRQTLRLLTRLVDADRKNHAQGTVAAQILDHLAEQWCDKLKAWHGVGDMFPTASDADRRVLLWALNAWRSTDAA
jgi:hypothetical protein